MEMRDLGRTGLKITPIGLGCWQLQQGKGMTGKMWSALDQATMDAIVAAALRGGIILVRHRPGLRQRTLGVRPRAPACASAASSPAASWSPPSGCRSSSRRATSRAPSTSASECLSPYPIDLYQVHIPWSLSSVAAQMREMAALVRAGKVRAVGVSNFSAQADGPGRRGTAGGGPAARLQPGADQPAGPRDRDERRPRPGARAPRDPDRLLAARPGHPHRPVPRGSVRASRRCPGGAAPG